MISATELQQLKALIEREGGVAGFVRVLADAWGDATIQKALDQIGANLSLGVKDWVALKAQITKAADSITLDRALKAVAQAVRDKDQTRLGPALAVSSALAAKELGISLE